MKRIKLTLQLLFILLLGACAAKNTADVNQSTTPDKNDYKYLGDSYLSDFYIIASQSLGQLKIFACYIHQQAA